MKYANIDNNILEEFLINIGIEKGLINDKNLLIQALTHKSYSADYNEEFAHNERLEFVGDGVLGAVITTLLFSYHDDKSEAEMTLYKIALIREETLAEVARDIGLDKIIMISNGEERSGGRNKDAILADCLEALIGYIHIDLGYEKAYRFVERWIYSKIKNFSDSTVRSFKTQLQEYIQKEHKVIPRYEDTEIGVDENGNQSFSSKVFLNEDILAEGVGSSKKKAQEDAAMKAMGLIEG